MVYKPPAWLLTGAAKSPTIRQLRFLAHRLRVSGRHGGTVEGTVSRWIGGPKKQTEVLLFGHAAPESVAKLKKKWGGPVARVGVGGGTLLTLAAMLRMRRQHKRQSAG